MYKHSVEVVGFVWDDEIVGYSKVDEDTSEQLQRDIEDLFGVSEEEEDKEEEEEK